MNCICHSLCLKPFSGFWFLLEKRPIVCMTLGVYRYALQCNCGNAHLPSAVFTAPAYRGQWLLCSLPVFSAWRGIWHLINVWSMDKWNKGWVPSDWFESIKWEGCWIWGPVIIKYLDTLQSLLTPVFSASCWFCRVGGVGFGVLRRKWKHRE